MAKDAQAAKGGTNEATGGPEKEEASPVKLSITMDKRVDLMVIVAMFLLGVFVVIAARGFRPGTMPDPITSQGMPIIMGIFFIIVGSVMGVLRLMTWRALPGNFVPAEGKTDEEGHTASPLRAFCIAAAGLLWVWLISALGYLFVTPLFLVAGLLLMGVRSRLKIIAFPVIYTLVTWVIFSQVLKIVVPLGLLTDYFRELRLIP
jgi:hypothetical protein